MKDFLSNSWVVSIISGVIVFFLTNAFIMLQNRRKYKKQIKDANIMILNRIRGYVVDNGLPQKEVIKAVKSSTSREYNVKYDELLSIREFCEELITDIIGNIYISNDNKVKYINTLQEYLQNNLNESTNLNERNLENNNNHKEIEIEIGMNRRISSLVNMILPILATALTIAGISLFLSNETGKEINEFNMYTDFSNTIFAFLFSIIISIAVSCIIPILIRYNKKTKKKIKRIIRKK